MQQLFCFIFFVLKLNEILAVKTEVAFEIINNLTMHLQLDLNLYINCQPDFANKFYIHNNLTPKLIIDYESVGGGGGGSGDIKIIGHETERLLTIVFVEFGDERRNTIDVLVNVLWQLHFTNVLFIYGHGSVERESQLVVSELYELFKLCWKNGFVNVLVVINQQTLFTYHPFPSIKVQQLSSLNDYYNKSHLRNFQGYPIRSFISNNAPRVYHYRDKHGNLVNAGYLYEVLMAFIKNFNGTYREVPMPTYAQNLTNIIRAFEAKEIDIAADLLYAYANYSRSIVICIYRTFLMVPNAKPLASYIYILKPMSGFVWSLVAVLICLAIALQMFLHWLHTQTIDFGVALLRTTTTILYLPYDYYRDCSRLQAFCTALILLGGLMLTNFYQTGLASMLITRLHEPKLKSLEDIARTNYNILQTDVDATYLRSLSGVPPIIYDRIVHATADEVYRWRRNLSTSYIHSGIEDKVKFYMHQQLFLRTPVFSIVDEPLYQIPLFFSIAQGSPFILQLNEFLKYSYVAGIIAKLYYESMDVGILSGEIEFFPADALVFVPLTLGHFSLAFGIWAFSMLVALICFLIERTTKSFN